MKFLTKLFHFIKPAARQGVVIRFPMNENLTTITRIKLAKGILKNVNFIEQNEFSQVLKLIKKTEFVSLYIQAENTLIKSIKSSGNQQSDLEQLFPSIDHEKFWIEKAEIEDTCYYALTPIAEINELLGTLVEKGIYPYNVFTGLLVLAKIDRSRFQFTSTADGKHITDPKSILEGLQAQEINIRYQNTLVDESNALGFITAINNGSEPKGNFRFQDLTGLAFLQVFLTKKIAYGFGMLIFILLSINTVWLTNLQQTNNDLNDKLSMSGATLAQYKTKKQKVDKQSALVKNLSLDRPLHLSTYSDQIASSVPSKITLTLLHLNADLLVLEDERNGARDRSQSMLLKGEVYNDLQFDEWISTIKSFDWVQNIDIQDFEFKPEYGFSTFKLEVQIDQTS